MANRYLEWKNKGQSDYNKLPIYWAFGDKQWKELLEKLGLTEENAKDNLLQLGTGGIMLKSEYHLYRDFVKNINTIEEHMNDYEFMKQAFEYELANHEFCITYEYEDTLDALGLTEDEVLESELLKKALIEAKDSYLASVNWE